MILNKKKWIAGGAGVIVVLIVIFGVITYNKNLSNAVKDPKPDSAASSQDQTIDAWGEVKYDKVYDISIDFPSFVTDVKVKEGDHVSMGDPLVTFDSAEYQSSCNKLQQQLSVNEADIAQTQKDIATKTQQANSGSKAELKLLQNSLTRAKKEVADAKVDVQNYQSLYSSGAVSKDTLDQYTDLLNQKQKAQTDVEDNIEKTKRTLGEELDQLNLSLKSKQAQSVQLKSDLEVLKNKSLKNYIKGNQIVSCVSNGIVQNISVMNASKLGVQNAPVKVLQLIDADSIVISAEVQEEFITKISLGKTVNIVPTADKNLSIPGIVTQISNVAVEKDGKRIVKVEVKPQTPNAILKPGYSADVYFPTR
jgi:HlyD family secretion protein